MPNTRPPSPRPRLLAFAFVALTALPGCLTQQVWEGHGAAASDEALPTAARVALTPVALTGDALVCAALAVAYVGPYACCCCRR
jgi:hypothetical protein